MFYFFLSYSKSPVPIPSLVFNIPVLQIGNSEWVELAHSHTARGWGGGCQTSCPQVRSVCLHPALAPPVEGGSLLDTGMRGKNQPSQGGPNRGKVEAVT